MFCLSIFLSQVPKHQDGGMYKSPYSGYPFLMLPEPYLPNGSVSPSVSSSSLPARSIGFSLRHASEYKTHCLILSRESLLYVYKSTVLAYFDLTDGTCLCPKCIIWGPEIVVYAVWLTQICSCMCLCTRVCVYTSILMSFIINQWLFKVV